MAAMLSLANLLTALRAVLIVPTALAIHGGNNGLGACLFILAALSDYYDGRVARARGQSSAAGGVFDHATDALFVSACLLAAALIGLTTLLLPPLILLAFAQYAFDSSVLAGRALRGSALGRLNGIAYFVLAGLVIGLPLGLSWLPPHPALQQASSLLLMGSSIVLVVTTLLSMGNRARYWWHYRQR